MWALDAAYGDGLERVILFGSRARRRVSPLRLNVAVFLKDFGGFGREEAARIAAVETDIVYDTGAVIHALPFRAGAYDDRTRLMHELRREGREL